MAAGLHDTEREPRTTRRRWWGQSKGAVAPPGSGAMGMKLFLASVTVLFAATIVAYLVVAAKKEWRESAFTGGWPVTLWFSTGVLFLSSWPLYSALSAVRRDDQRGLRRGMLVATILGGVFVLGQGVAWVDLFVNAPAGKLTGLYVFTFYMLTVTHALHVLGGIVPMVVTTRNAFRGHYDSLFHPAVQYCNWYWHYLGVVWAVLFAILLLAA